VGLKGHTGEHIDWTSNFHRVVRRILHENPIVVFIQPCCSWITLLPTVLRDLKLLGGGAIVRIDQ
jgi:hypothetical protein